MSDPKQLKFQFVVDEASLQKTRQLIRELTADLTKLNAEATKAGGMLGGGAGGVRVGAGAQTSSPEQQRVISKTAPVAQPLVRGFLNQKEIFKGIADGSKESLRAMSAGVKESVSKQKQELDSLERSARKLRATYEELTKTTKMLESKGHPLAGEARADQNRFREEYLDPTEARLRIRQRTARGGYGGGGGDEVPPPPPVNGGGDGPGLFGERKMSPKMRMALRMGTALLAGGSMALDESLAGIGGMTGMAARRSDLVSGQMSRLMGGDVKLTYAMKAMDPDYRRDLRDVTDSFSGKADMVRNSARQALGGLPLIGSLISGGGKANGGIGGAFTTGEQQSYQAEKAMQQAEAYSRTLIMQNMAMDRFSSGLGSRISAGRTLGVGRNFDPRKGWVDSYGRMEDELQARGYSIGEKQGAKLQLQAMGGERFAFQYADAAMRANAQGLGGYGGLLAAGQRAGVGGDFARGAIGTGDQTAGIMLGQSIIGNGFDPRGTTTGMGALMAAQGGFGWSGNASDFNTAQRVGLGMQSGDALTTGALDPYQKARNLVSAIRGNPGMNIYGQDYLANGMSLKQMIDMGTGNSPLTATAEALGLSGAGIKSQLGASVSSVVDRYKDTGASDPMSQTIRAFRGFQRDGGGGVSEFFDSLSGSAKTDAVRNLGAFYGIQTGSGEEAGLGLMGLQAGLSNAQMGALKKGDVGRRFGQTEQDAVAGMAAASSMVTSEFERMGKMFNDTLKDLPADFTKMKNFGERLDKSASDFIKSLGELTNAINASTAKLGGGYKVGAK